MGIAIAVAVEEPIFVLAQIVQDNGLKGIPRSFLKVIQTKKESAILCHLANVFAGELIVLYLKGIVIVPAARKRLLSGKRA